MDIIEARRRRACYQSRKGAGQSGYFLTVIFPHNQVQILPYNRVLKDLNGLSPAQLLEKLDGVFIIQTPGAAHPVAQTRTRLLSGRKMAHVEFPPAFRCRRPIQSKSSMSRLLQKYVLDPIFGIDDPRTSKRINFVGGIRGTAELEKLVNSGEYACAFSMFPTSIEDLMTIADAGGIMPPKSTWFEPKLRDAMFCHMIFKLAHSLFSLSRHSWLICSCPKLGSNAVCASPFSGWRLMCCWPQQNSLLGFSAILTRSSPMPWNRFPTFSVRSLSGAPLSWPLNPPMKIIPMDTAKRNPSSAIVATILLIAALGISILAIREMFSPHQQAPFTLIVLLATVAIKELLFRVVVRESAQIESSVVRADAWHHHAAASPARCAG